jgi:hypothetical protein
MRLSFISEHSLEYVVVPRICEVLRANYKVIVPIYYWATREGNTLSRELHGNMKLRILSVFPRRPKVEKIDSDVVYGKINRSVMKFTEAANSFGIPTIFGFPLVKSFLDISNDCKCLFLNVTKYEDGDIHFKVKKEANSIDVVSEQKTIITMLDNAAILAIVSKGRVLNWDDALLHMNDLRNINEEYSRFWMSQYKPVYILLFQ